MQEEVLEKLTTIENLLKGQTDKHLTFNEAAQYLDISKSYLYKLTSGRKIRHWKPTGKRIYFAKHELDAWIFRNPVNTTGTIEQEADDYLVNGGKRGVQ